MKLGFTSTQLGLSEKQVEILGLLLRSIQPEEFHHGDCKGGDEAGHQLARQHTRARIVAHPGHIPKKRAHCVADEIREPQNTLARNEQIVAETDMLLAAPGCEEYTRSGTWSTVRYARRQGQPIIIVLPNGEIRREGAAEERSIP
jgi:hypothetical protein